MSEWVEEAVCATADPEEWFPAKGVSAHRAKRICQTCPVIDECLRYALDNSMTGIWGGTSHSQRILMQRRAS